MLFNSFILCFLFFLLVIFSQKSYALNKGDVGTCDGRVSSIGSKQVTYWVMGRCKNAPRKTCRARRWKTVTFIKWTSGTICCEGYKHDSDLDACKPICSTGCLNGHCTGPETCNCNPPLYLDPIRKNICLSPPVCNPSCVNAKCVIKEENFSNVERRGFCECLVNTRRYNDSHCAYCQEGFKINPDLSCMPICKTPCNNGECIAPNKCKCSEGYRAKNDLICEPHCEFCVNSDCVEPNKCKCHPGFSIVNNTHCEQCDCENGDCVLGQCVCHDGYILNEGVCEPVCDKPCVNSVCVAPSMCACFEGHRKSNVSRVCCRPECGGVCNADGECPTVACVPS